MSETADLNTTTVMPSRGQFGMRLEGLAIAALYVLFFGWMHMNTGVEFLSVRVLVVFFGGLIVVPLLTGLPIVYIRRALMDMIRSQPSVAAFSLFANVAIYALQGLLIWVVTREGYNWAFASMPAL